MSATDIRVERKPTTTLIHQIFHKEVLLQKQNLEVYEIVEEANRSEQRLMENREISEDVASQETNIFE
jgi:hypothetical protein